MPLLQPGDGQPRRRRGDIDCPDDPASTVEQRRANRDVADLRFLIVECEASFARFQQQGPEAAGIGHGVGCECLTVRRRDQALGLFIRQAGQDRASRCSAEGREARTDVKIDADRMSTRKACDEDDFGASQAGQVDSLAAVG